MSDSENDPQELIELSKAKPKRQMTEKQLQNLAKARQVRLMQRKEQKEVTQKRKEIKKLKQVKVAKSVDADYQQLLLELDNLQKKTDSIAEQKEREKVVVAKKKPKVIRYVEEEDSESEAEEVVIKKTIKRKPVKKSEPIPIPVPEKPVDHIEKASKEIIQDKIDKMRNDLLYKSIFPDS